MSLESSIVNLIRQNEAYYKDFNVNFSDLSNKVNYLFPIMSAPVATTQEALDAIKVNTLQTVIIPEWHSEFPIVANKNFRIFFPYSFVLRSNKKTPLVHLKAKINIIENGVFILENQEDAAKNVAILADGQSGQYAVINSIIINPVNLANRGIIGVTNINQVQFFINK